MLLKRCTQYVNKFAKLTGPQDWKKSVFILILPVPAGKVDQVLRTCTAQLRKKTTANYSKDGVTSVSIGVLLAILCSLFLHLDFGITLSDFTKKSVGFFNLSYIESIDQLGEKLHLYDIKSSQLWTKYIACYLFRAFLWLLTSFRIFSMKIY